MKINPKENLNPKRFLLVNPFCPLSENPSPPLGLSYLAAALETAGVTVKILDFVVFPYSNDLLASVIKSFTPLFVGVTAVSMTVHQAFKIIRDVKAISPDVITTMGGPHVTFLPEETFRVCSELDVIALGEAEETIVELAAAGKNRSVWKNISGLSFRTGTVVHYTKKRSFARDVNTLPPPARHLLPLGRYRALNMSISMTTSRGCPYKCIFCVGRKMVGQKVRYRHPHIVVDELTQLAAFGFPQINIADDLFTLNKKHCMAICSDIIDRRLNIKWSAFSRVDTISPELLSHMKNAGCTSLGFGVESADADILAQAKKGITIGQVMAAIHMCKDAGITAAASFILGLPGETPETLRKTVAFGKKLDDMGVLYGFHMLAPFPGTEVRLKHDNYNIQILTDDWRRYHANRAISETAHVSREMLDRIVIDWEEKIESWYDEIRSKMNAGQPPNDDAEQIINLDRIQIIYDLMMNRTMEEKGISVNGDGSVSETAALAALAETIEPSDPTKREKISAALSHTTALGNLRYVKKNSHMAWEWVDFI